MRAWVRLIVCLTTLAPWAARAEEGCRFPPLPPIRIGDLVELRASTARRGLAMLPRCIPPSLPSRQSGPFALGGSGIGGGGASSPRPEPLAERLASSGVEVILAKGLPHEAEMAQARFAPLFSRADPAPVARTEHFDWIPHYDDHPVAWNSGWRAEIGRVEPATAGGWKITVRMQPRLRTTGFLSLIADFVEETYRLHDDSIELIGSDAETPKAELHVFPVAI